MEPQVLRGEGLGLSWGQDRWVSIPGQLQALCTHLTPNPSGSTRILQMVFSPSSCSPGSRQKYVPGWSKPRALGICLALMGLLCPGSTGSPQQSTSVLALLPSCAPRKASLVVLAWDESESLSFPTQHICVSHVALDGCL